MVFNGRLSAEDHVGAQFAAPCDPRLGNYYPIFSYDNVMRYLNQVVYLCPLFYPCLVKCGPVNSGVSSYLDIVFYLDYPRLRYLVMPFPIPDKSETVSPDNSPGMY